MEFIIAEGHGGGWCREEKAFSVAAPKIWNSLPPSITACDNYCTFESKLKTDLFTT